VYRIALVGLLIQKWHRMEW